MAERHRGSVISGRHESVLGIEPGDALIPGTWPVKGQHGPGTAGMRMPEYRGHACLLDTPGKDPAAQQEIVNMQHIVSAPGEHCADQPAITEAVACVNTKHQRCRILDQLPHLRWLETLHGQVELV